MPFPLLIYVLIDDSEHYVIILFFVSTVQVH
jgi:hypothetical protein